MGWKRKKWREIGGYIFCSDINGDGIYVCSDFRKCSAMPTVNLEEKCENEIDAQVKGWSEAALNNKLAALVFLYRTVLIRIIAEEINLPNLRNFAFFQDYDAKETIASLLPFFMTNNMSFEFEPFFLSLCCFWLKLNIYLTWCLCFASTLVL